MNLKIKNDLIPLAILIIPFLVCGLIYYPERFYEIHGYPDFKSIINPLFNLYNTTPIHSLLTNLGTNHSYEVQAIPLFIFYLITSSIGLDQNQSTSIFFYLLFTSSIYLFYNLSCKVLINKALFSSLVFNRLIIFSFSMLYGFSMYVIDLIMPGHILFLVVYALFPLLIKFNIDFLNNNISYKKSLSLFILVFFMAIGFGNIGNFISLLLVLFFFNFIFILIDLNNFKNNIKAIGLFFLLMFFSCLFWLPHNLVNIASRLFNDSVTFTHLISDLVRYASHNFTISKLFAGNPVNSPNNPDIMRHSLYLSTYYIVGSFFVSFFYLYTFLLKHRIKLIVAFIGTSLLILLLVKGPTGPFNELFDYLYQFNIFKIFRRPSSKLYGFFLFFFIFISLYGLLYLSKHLSFSKKTLFIILIFLFSFNLYSFYIFSKNPNGEFFNFDHAHHELKNDISKEVVRNFIVVPSSNGEIGHYFNYTVSIDPLYDYLGKGVIYTQDEQHGAVSHIQNRNLITKIANDIFTLKFCDVTRNSDITHILLRKDFKTNGFENKLKDAIRYENSLNNNSSLELINTYNTNAGDIVLYRVSENCINNNFYVQPKWYGGKLKFLNNSIYDNIMLPYTFDPMLFMIRVDSPFDLFSKDNFIFPKKNNSRVNYSHDKLNKNHTFYIVHFQFLIFIISFLLFLISLLFLAYKAFKQKNEN